MEVSSHRIKCLVYSDSLFFPYINSDESQDRVADQISHHTKTRYTKLAFQYTLQAATCNNLQPKQSTKAMHLLQFLAFGLYTTAAKHMFLQPVAHENAAMYIWEC